MSIPTIIPPPPRPLRPAPIESEVTPLRPDGPTLRIVEWVDPVADPHGMHPCSRYVELYWLGIVGPPTCLTRPVVKERSGCDDPERDHESRHLLTHQS